MRPSPSSFLRRRRSGALHAFSLSSLLSLLHALSPPSSGPLSWILSRKRAAATTTRAREAKSVAFLPAERAKARGRGRDLGGVFSFLFRFSRPLFTFRPSFGGSLAVVSNELCLLLLFFSFLPAHFSLFHFIKTRIVTFFYHRRNERRERERERTGERRKRGAFFLHFFFFLWLMPSALTSLSRRPTSSR